MTSPRHIAAVCLAFLGCLTLLWASPARAELVVFEEGAYLKVVSYELYGEKIKLGLPEGGFMTVKMERISRILDDEIVPEPPAPPMPEVMALVLDFVEDQPIPQVPFGNEIYQAARRHSLNPQVVAAVVKAESAFNDRARSPKGARGLMQLMPATADRFGVQLAEIHDPVKNLDAGSRYLRWLIDRFDGDLLRALAAYNAGEGTVDRYGGVPPYRETQGYVRRIYTTLGLDQPI
jgi:hypothetical protein